MLQAASPQARTRGRVRARFAAARARLPARRSRRLGRPARRGGRLAELTAAAPLVLRGVRRALALAQRAALARVELHRVPGVCRDRPRRPRPGGAWQRGGFVRGLLASGTRGRRVQEGLRAPLRGTTLSLLTGRGCALNAPAACPGSVPAMPRSHGRPQPHAQAGNSICGQPRRARRQGGRRARASASNPVKSVQRRGVPEMHR